LKEFGMKNEDDIFCDRCDGSGKLRANYEKDGKYVFHKEVCYKCKGIGINKKYLKPFPTTR
jgi:DnaJ-class molecular chaperone